jgi:hypothetical protein
MPNEVVEISGYVMQDQGAFAHFNLFKTTNAKLGGTTTLEVVANRARDSAPFQKGHDLTVMLRAAKVWATVLAEGQDQQYATASNAAGAGTMWARIKGVAGPEKYPPDTLTGHYPVPPAPGAGATTPHSLDEHPASVATGNDEATQDPPPSHEAG